MMIASSGWPENGLEVELAHALPGEDGLDEDRAAQRRREPEDEAGDDGRRRDAQDVAPPDEALGQALGARHGDVVLECHVQRHRADDVDRGPDAHEHEREDGQERMPEQVREGSAGRPRGGGVLYMPPEGRMRSQNENTRMSRMPAHQAGSPFVMAAT